MIKTLSKSILEFKKPAILTPVSYTHLDVYKRQIQSYDSYAYSKFFRIIQYYILDLIAQTERRIYAYAVSRMYARALYMPVSYTHLTFESICVPLPTILYIKVIDVSFLVHTDIGRRR